MAAAAALSAAAFDACRLPDPYPVTILLLPVAYRS